MPVRKPCREALDIARRGEKHPVVARTLNSNVLAAQGRSQEAAAADA
jgi:hypothetical protein